MQGKLVTSHEEGNAKRISKQWDKGPLALGQHLRIIRHLPRPEQLLNEKSSINSIPSGGKTQLQRAGRSPLKACALFSMMFRAVGAQRRHNTFGRTPVLSGGVWKEIPGCGWQRVKLARHVKPQNSVGAGCSESTQLMWTLQEGRYELHLTTLIIKVSPQQQLTQ